MVYGLIFLEHKKFSAQEQRDGISLFAKRHHLILNDFISFDNNPNILNFKPGDTIICYAWNCLCKETTFLRAFIQHLIKNEVCIYSTTSKFYIDENTDVNTVKYAFAMYEDIRFNFCSYKNFESACKRIVSGRRVGSRNKRHVLDGKEKAIWDMYNSGSSMYAIAKKMRVSAPTIKTFLTNNN